MLTPLLIVITLISLISLTLSIYLLYLFKKINNKLQIILFISKTQNYLKIFRKLKENPRIRYIVFEVIADCEINERDLWREFSRAVTTAIGRAGLAKSGASLVYFSPAKGIGIVRVREPFKNSILGTLGLIRRVDSCKTVIIPLRTTGTIKSAKKYINKYYK